MSIDEMALEYLTRRRSELIRLWQRSWVCHVGLEGVIERECVTRRVPLQTGLGGREIRSRADAGFET